MPTEQSTRPATKPRIPAELRARAAAAGERSSNWAEPSSGAGSTGGSSRTSGAGGPAPGRIVAAAASISAGLGLMTIMAGQAGGPEVVIEVQPTPVVVQNRTVMAPQPAAAPTEIRTVEAATPAPAPEPSNTPAPVTESEGS